MAQNIVQSTNNIFIEDEIWYIANYSTSMTNNSLNSLTGATWNNIGSLADFSVEPKIDTIQPPSVNVEHDQYVSRMAETINVTLQELNMTIYNQIMGSMGQSQAITGSSTSVIDTYTTNAYPSTSIERFTAFTQQNWGSSGGATSTSATIPIVPTGIVISGSSTFVNDVDYLIMQDDSYNWGFVIQSTGHITSTGGASLTISYSFVPKAQDIIWDGGADTITPFMLKRYSITADNRTLTIYYPRVTYISGGGITPKKAGTGEIKDIKFVLEAREHPSFTYNSRKQYRITVKTTE
jgi:hypothetical protein